MKTYGPFDLTSFRVGDRVEIGPHLDRWMRGDRFGTVEEIGRAILQLRMDSLAGCKARPSDIFAIID